MNASELRQQWKDIPEQVKSHERFLGYEIAAQLAEINETLKPRQVQIVHHTLLNAAENALQEMCNTPALNDSFTDAVDKLDAAIRATKGKP